MGKYVYDLLKNNNYNLKLINETLWDIRALSFNILYEAQESLSDIERFDGIINSNNLLKENDYRYIYNINLDFIFLKNRIKFKESEFYNKDISFNDIISNPDIFNKVPLVFINGELYQNIHFIPNEESTSLVFKVKINNVNSPQYTPYSFVRSVLYDIMNDNSNITIFFIPLSYVAKNMVTLPMSEIKTNYNLNINDRLESMNDLTPINDYFTFMYTSNNVYKLLNTTYNNNRIYFNQNEIDSYTNISTVDLRLFSLKNYLTKIDVPSTDNYFQLDIQDMPIPTNNMIIFRRTNNKLYLDHETTISIHYPNIYEVNKTHNDDIIVYAFYYDDTTFGSKYTSEIRLYYRFITDVLDRYKNDSIPNLIKNYQAITVHYDNNNFNDYNLYPDHLSYKINELNNLIYNNGDFYSNYLNRLVRTFGEFYVDVSNIDLTERIRQNNHTEILDIASQVSFDEAHYVFTFRHEENETINIYLDNYRLNPIIYNDEKYSYVYIPTNKVNQNSRMEIEKFYDEQFKQSIVFTANNTYIPIYLPEDKYFPINDLFLSKKIGDDEFYIDKEHYEIFVLENNVYTKIDVTTFFPYGTVYIKFKLDHSADYLNQELYANISRINFNLVTTADNMTITNTINNDIRNFQVFKNGRLFPEEAYTITFNEKITGPHLIEFGMRINPNEEIIVSYTRNKRVSVYNERSINNYGKINVTNLINKPIDLKWYDIYLNGLKLHKNNVDIITPYKFIIRNIPTLKNLYIQQKNLDLEVIQTNLITDDIADKIYPYIEPYLDVTEITDELTDIMDDLGFILIDFIEYLIDLGLLNPDLQQLEDDFLQTYNYLVDENSNVYVNSGQLLDDSTGQDIIMNPDQLILSNIEEE